MVFFKGALAAATGVLLLVTLPVALGGTNPVESDLDPTMDAAEGVVDGGQYTAEQHADEAQEELGETQGEATGAARDAERDAKHKVGEGSASVISFLSDAQLVVGSVLSTLGKVLDENNPLTDGSRADPGTGSSPVSTQSAAAVPAFIADQVGLVLVLVAGAAGGALLWTVVLQRVVLFGLYPLLSRIARSELYSNDARRLIADLVATGPGLCLNEIVGKTAFSRNAVSYHLFVLEKEEELVSIKDGKYRRYFPRSGKYVNGAKNVVSVLRNESSLKIAQHVTTHPGAMQRDLCALVGTTASAVCWHMKRLENLHLVRKERVANTVHYYPGDAIAKYDLSDFGLSRDAAPALAPVPVSA